MPNMFNDEIACLSKQAIFHDHKDIETERKNIIVRRSDRFETDYFN